MPLLGARWACGCGGLAGTPGAGRPCGAGSGLAVAGRRAGCRRGVGRAAVPTAVGGRCWCWRRWPRRPLVRQSRWRTTRWPRWPPSGAAVGVDGTVDLATRARSPGRFGDQVLVAARRSARSPAAARPTSWPTPVLVLGDAELGAAPLGPRCGFTAGWRRRRRRRPGGCSCARGLARGAGGRRTSWWRAAGAVRARAARLGGAPAGRPAGAGAGAGRRRRRRRRPGACRRLPRHRADPPAGGLRHQPDPGRRLPAGAGPLVPGARALAATWSARPGIVGFVLLARTEPSVLRAAVMGTVGAGRAGRRRPAARALAALGRAVVVLVLLDPALAVSAGFALSVLATGGILLLAPGLARRAGAAGCRAGWPRRSPCRRPPSSPARRWWRRSPGRSAWWPWWPTCVVAPVVGPATVLGLAGGLLGLVWPTAGRLLGTLAAWCVAWIVRSPSAAPRCRPRPSAGAPACCRWRC